MIRLKARDWLAIGVTVLVASALVAGCSDGSTDDEPYVAPPGSAYIETPYNGWNYGTWTTCDRGNRLYYVFGSAGQAIDVVPGDPTCAPGVER